MKITSRSGQSMWFSFIFRVGVPVGLTVILFIGSFLLVAVPQIESDLMNSKRELIRELTQTAWQLVANYEQLERAGEYTRAEAQHRAKERVRWLRYGANQEGYFFISDMDVRAVMHPITPEVEGQDSSHITDSQGKYLVQEIVKVAREQGEGYVDYIWHTQRDPTQETGKISYVKRFGPWEWVIGTGVYMEDIQQEIGGITGKMFYAYGGILAVIGVMSFLVIRQGVRAEKSLQVSEERMRITQENAPVGMVTWDRKGRFLSVNPALVGMLGYSPEELGQMTLGDITAAESRAEGQAQMEALWKGEIPSVQMETRYERKNGQVLDGLVHARLVWDRAGEGLFAVAMVSDISARKEGERERERLLETLETKNKELENIIYVGSHDLRSPLVNIQGFSQILAKSCRKLEGLLERLAISKASKEEISSIVEKDILVSLDYICSSTVKVDSLQKGLIKLCRLGRADMTIRRLNMNHIIRDIVKNMQYRIDQKQVTVTVEELPDCLGDELQIGQVFSNLLDNAVKYLDPRRAGRIYISACDDDHVSTYCVQDNGIGIDSRYYEKVFEIFHQLEPNGSAEGEGLGLSIVRRIVERHNGKVWIDSERGKGSSFYVALPHWKNMERGMWEVKSGT